VVDQTKKSVKRDLALIYVRESSHRLGDPDESPERQIARSVQLCEGRGWRHEIFQEPPGHRSGKYEAGRPAWKDLKERLRQPNVIAVVVSRLDRASRSLVDFSNFLTYLNKYGVEFVSVKENFDTSSAMGKAFLRVILILLELESDVTSERLLEMIAYKKERGLTWGTIPYGYTRKKNLLSISDEGVKHNGQFLKDTDALKFVLEGYAKGELSYQGGAKRLNAMGYRMRDRFGKRDLFGVKAIRTFVENAMLYAGFVPGKDGWRKAPHPAIISEELARRIEEARLRRKRTGGHAPNHIYPLSPLLVCGKCGVKLHGGGPINGKWYYRHYVRRGSTTYCQKGGTQVEATFIEEGVRDFIRSLRVPDEAEPILQNLAQARVRMLQEGEAEKISAKIEDYERQFNRAKKLFVTGDFTEADYEEQKRTLEKLLGEERSKLAPLPYDVGVMIAKVHEAGNLIAQKEDPLIFKRAVNLLFERLEATRQENGVWKLSKVIPREEFREFF
jgi:DNA invertase Pin-like site-specific DNA recombinase